MIRFFHVSYYLCILIGILLNLIITTVSYGGLDKLVEYAAPNGSMSNINTPAIIKDQSGGYMTGGSILLRGPRPKDLDPVNVQTPKLKFDACTGSGDFRFGAMSYISASEFSNFLKGVARASGAYLVKMSIKTACPQCEDIMTYLETVARDINGLTMSQCSMAQSLAAGSFSKLTSSEKQHCMMESNAMTHSNDMFETTKRCQEEAGGRARPSSGEFESMLGDEFNLVWKALSKGAGGDVRFKELMMSVSGTIIGVKEDGRYKFTSKPSLLQDKELLERYIGTNNGASKIKLYVCNEAVKCLMPKEQETTLAYDKTLYGNVSKIIRSLVTKIVDDKHVLTDEEQALLGFSTIPILHIIEMEISSKAATSDILSRISEFVEVICYDVITNYMQVMLTRVLSNVLVMEHAQIDNVIIRRFIEDAENIRKYLRDAKFGAFQKLQVIMEIKERLNNQTKEFEFRFGKMMEHIEK